MNEKPQDMTDQLSDEDAAQLMRSLLQKQDNWVVWGKACQTLQKAGYTSQTIFEQTGFQASQQNLIIVAVQVYESLLKAGVNEEILAYYRGPRSDILYEFRILNQEQRAKAAILAKDKKLDIDEAKEVAKAIQEFSRLFQIPTEFTSHPGDIIAYQCWKRARQKKDLQERSRFIAKGLKFADSISAREAIERLLSDFSIVPSRSAPLLPIYRLEEEKELTRIIPLIEEFPPSKAALETVTALEITEPFRAVYYSGTGVMVPLPGWQVILKAENPVALLWQSDQLPRLLSGKSEVVLVVIDRAITQWDDNSYFLLEQDDKLVLQWFEEAPIVPLLGQMLLVLKSKKILDENNLTEPWQMDD